jgi:hypothetical protein
MLPVLYVALQAVRPAPDAGRLALGGGDAGHRAMGAALVIFVIGIATNASMAALWLMAGLPAATFYLLCLLPLHWMVARD